jgi:MATE family multidrug resistance protein
MSPLSVTTFRAEARANLRLALPLILAQLSFVSMGTVDTLVAGRMGASQLAAVAVGANIWFVLFILFMGLFMACTPIVAQRVGAGRDPALIGLFVRRAAVLAVAMGLAWMLALYAVMAPALDWLGLQAQTRAYAAQYLFAASWSAVPFCLCFVARNAAEGHGLTRAPPRNSQASAARIAAIGAPSTRISRTSGCGCGQPRRNTSSARSCGCRRYSVA